MRDNLLIGFGKRADVLVKNFELQARILDQALQGIVKAARISRVHMASQEEFTDAYPT